MSEGGGRRAGAEAAAELLKALAHPLRIDIITSLAKTPMCVHELVDATGASQVLVSQHLRVLRAADTVRGTRRGKEIEYALLDPHVGHIVGDAVSHATEARAETATVTTTATPTERTAS